MWVVKSDEVGGVCNMQDADSSVGNMVVRNQVNMQVCIYKDWTWVREVEGGFVENMHIF